MRTKFTLLILATLILATTSLHAQISKGSIVPGGNLSFYTNNLKSTGNLNWKENNTSVFVSPSLMFVTKDDRGIGFMLNYGHLKTETAKSDTYGIGIFLRQYKPLSKSFYIFIQEGLNYSYSKGKLDSSISTLPGSSISNTLNASVNPGIAYDLTRKLQLEMIFFNNLLSMSYSNTKITDYNNNGYKSNSFSAISNLDLSQLTAVNFGSRFFFGR